MTTYLEDLAEGQKIESERRVVSAADIDAFCELSGDHNPLHTDDEHARAAGFAGRIAHGLLVLSIATGLRSEEDDWAIGAYLEASTATVAATTGGTLNIGSEADFKTSARPLRPPLRRPVRSARSVASG